MEKKSVYIMQFGEMCKVGVSKNPQKRLKDIQIGNPNIKLIYQSTLIFNAYEIENKVHRIYKENSIGKEWFLIKDTTEIILTLRQFVETDGIFYIEKKNNKNTNKLLDEIIYAEIKRLQEEVQNIRQETSNMKEENKRVNDFLSCILGTKNECDYTNLIYRTLFNKTAKQLKHEYGVKSKENLRDYFIGSDLEKVQSAEMLVSSLINCGWGYGEIKEFITNQAPKLIAVE